MTITSMALEVGAGTADSLVQLAAAIPIAAIGYYAMRRSPFVALLLFLTSICLIPFWEGINIKFYFQPAAIIGLAAIAALLPAQVRRLSVADWLLLAVFATCLIPALFGLSFISAISVVLTQWLIAFIAGRLLPTRIGLPTIYRWVAIFFTVTSGLAIFEFISGWNFFLSVFHADNLLYQAWDGLQRRGGIVRAEGAFGHSIALGACIALAIPMVIASNFKLSTRLMMTSVLLGGAVVTFSRIGMICSVLGTLLSVIFLKSELSGRARAWIVGTIAVLGAALLPVVVGVFSRAGSEATGSANYRTALIALVPDMAVLGVSASRHVTPAGEMYFGDFRSIDSALIFGGLSYGWLPMAIVVVLLVGAAGVVVLRRGSPATIAVVAQIPALLTVALITQYSMFLWFMVGLAVFGRGAYEITADGPPAWPRSHPESPVRSRSSPQDARLRDTLENVIPPNVSDAAGLSRLSTGPKRVVPSIRSALASTEPRKPESSSVPRPVLGTIERTD